MYKKGFLKLSKLSYKGCNVALGAKILYIVMY